MGKKIRIISIIFTFFCVLGISIFFMSSSGGFNTSMYKNPDYIKIVLAFIIFIILIVILYIYSSIKEKKKIEEIMNTVEPHDGVLEDILLFKYFTWSNDSYEARLKVYPIIRDLNNKKKYLSVNFHCIGTYKYSYYWSVFTKFKYELTNNNSEKVNIGDHCRIYVKKENGNLKLENDSIKIYDELCNYKGKLDGNNIISTSGGNLLFNVEKENFLEDINNITLFDGIVDFDIKK